MTLLLLYLISYVMFTHIFNMDIMCPQSEQSLYTCTCIWLLSSMYVVHCTCMCKFSVCYTNIDIHLVSETLFLLFIRSGFMHVRPSLHNHYCLLLSAFLSNYDVSCVEVIEKQCFKFLLPIQIIQVGYISFHISVKLHEKAGSILITCTKCMMYVNFCMLKHDFLY